MEILNKNYGITKMEVNTEVLFDLNGRVLTNFFEFTCIPETLKPSFRLRNYLLLFVVDNSHHRSIIISNFELYVLSKGGNSRLNQVA